MDFLSSNYLAIIFSTQFPLQALELCCFRFRFLLYTCITFTIYYYPEGGTKRAITGNGGI